MVLTLGFRASAFLPCYDCFGGMCWCRVFGYFGVTFWTFDVMIVTLGQQRVGLLFGVVLFLDKGVAICAPWVYLLVLEYLF